MVMTRRSSNRWDRRYENVCLLLDGEDKLCSSVGDFGTFSVYVLGVALCHIIYVTLGGKVFEYLMKTYRRKISCRYRK